jgi:hypothetical protein
MSLTGVTPSVDEACAALRGVRGTPGAESSLENQADAVRATGQNQADDMRTNDADTHLSNGI